jgi:hypothetical protein
VIEGWVTSKPVAILGKVYSAPRVMGPDANLAAVVVKLNSDNGIVKIVNGEREVEVFHTRPSEQEKSIMIILERGHHCIVMGNSSTKYVTKRVSP